MGNMNYGLELIKTNLGFLNAIKSYLKMCENTSTLFLTIQKEDRVQVSNF